MERSYSIGQHVVYVDKLGKRHDTLVTIWWGPGPGRVVAYQPDPTGEPGCNLVFVSGDPQKDDSYGRQIERETSVVHMQPAHGNFWCWPDE